MLKVNAITGVGRRTVNCMGDFFGPKVPSSMREQNSVEILKLKENKTIYTYIVDVQEIV